MQIFSAILISGMFLVSQTAFATDWEWTGGGATDNWSDTANWTCFEFDTGNPIACPAPGHPVTLLTAQQETIFISGLFSVTIDVPSVTLQEGTMFTIENGATVINNGDITLSPTVTELTFFEIQESTFTNSATITNNGITQIRETAFTNNGQVINTPNGVLSFIGPGAYTWINSATGDIINNGEFNIGVLETVQNSGDITNNPSGQLNNHGIIENECTGQFMGTAPNVNNFLENCVFSDADNIPDAIENLLTGSNTGLDITLGNDVSDVNFSFNSDSDIVIEGVDSVGDPIATVELPPGSTSDVNIDLKHQDKKGRAKLVLKGVTVPYPPGKDIMFASLDP
ncbi:MAG: hypothetical protein ACE5RJ_04450, partial [Nitrosopumilaceae archaeon]